jgi:protein dispatched 1
MAFISTGFSPLMPIATFGWFAATCIVMNYLLVITLMPTVVIVAEMWVDCSTPNDQDQDQEVGQAVPTDEVKKVNADLAGGSSIVPMEIEGNSSSVLSASEPEVVLGGGIKDDVHATPGPYDKLDASSVSNVKVEGKKQKQKQKPIRHYINFIEAGVTVKDRPVPLMSLLIVLSLLAYGIVGVYYGFQLEPPTKAEAWYPDHHMFTLLWESLGSDYLGADQNSYENIHLTMGIKGIDRTGFDVYRPGKNRGEPVYDEEWNLAAPACQKVMVRMCNDIVKYSCDADACKPTNLLARGNTTECFMVDFREWAQSSYSEDTYLMDEGAFYSRLEEFREKETQRYHDQVTWQDHIGFIDGELRFATVYFTSTMKGETGNTEKAEVAARLDDFVKRVKRYDECDECSCASLFYTSPFAFVWMKSEQGLVKGFYQGLSIAFPVALVVLLFATGNILLSLYAIVTVFFITFGVLGFAKYALDWNLGISESIAGIIIIGFSVDYTVHLGHMFNEGELHGLHTRKDKFEFASEKIVATIVGGAVTTAGAGVFMFACQLQFFFKMAALIVCTIVLSYVYSLGFFMALLYLIGPEKDEGNVVVYYDRAKAALGWAEACTEAPPPQKVSPQREYREVASDGKQCEEEEAEEGEPVLPGDADTA